MKPDYLDMWIESCRILGFKAKNAHEVAEFIGKDVGFVKTTPPSLNPFGARAA